MTRVSLYDTTLRDGAQQEGISLSVTDKLAAVAILDDLGVDVIEGGWPGAIPKDTEFFRRARDLELTHARLAAFGSTTKPGADPAHDPQVLALRDSGAPVITLVAKADPRHVVSALRTTLEENLRMVADTVSFLARDAEVMVDLEHFFDGLAADEGGEGIANEAITSANAPVSAGTPTPDEDAAVAAAAPVPATEYALAVLLEAARAGATTVIPCDTNGGNLPDTIAQVTARVRALLDAEGFGHVVLGIHCHNDTGCAVANTLAAVGVGARQVQGTVNGYGERTGNANLLTCLANLQIKLGYEVVSPGSVGKLSTVSSLFSELVNIAPFTRDPYVGQSAFAHKAGLHASAIRVDPDLYQHIDPAQVGNGMRMLVSEMAGRASIELKARELGVDLSGRPGVAQELARVVKQREAEGYTYDAADASFELLLRDELGTLPRFVRVESWKVSSQEIAEVEGRPFTQTEATVKVHTDGRHIRTAEGNGPVNALDRALRAVLIRDYPVVGDFELVDFRVRILDEQHAGTDATIRVLIRMSDGKRTWSTVGVGTDVIEASWEALFDGYWWGLLASGVVPLLVVEQA
ncbi:citramalate synthase [Actinomyces sp.]|uniref:(R)-citramalate synthase n=1 Tax=Actinomyces sp. TaxID=29317 RepID=UPI00289DCC4B|nr:citramalate synthase [Actinomyces sp.]